MNRNLLAGCAAVALAMGCGAANAQAKFDVKIGGDAYFEAGFVSQDRDSGLRTVEFRNRFRLNITPTAKADNGLEYGARARIRAGTGNTTITGDRAYVFVQGTFGQVRLGVTNSFNDDTYVSRPLDYELQATQNPVAPWVSSWTTAGTRVTNPVTGLTQGADVANLAGVPFGEASLQADALATKIVYYTPRFSGFQAGLSYTPRSDSVITDVNRIERSGNAAVAASYQDIIEVGANYKNVISGITLNASVGYMYGTATKNTQTGATAANDYNDLSAVQVGAQVGYAGFLLGGGYTYYGNSGLTKAAYLTGTGNTSAPTAAVTANPVYRSDAFQWNVGLQYTTGPVVVGGHYIAARDAGSLSTAGARHLDIYGVAAAYTVAPGLTVALEYNYFDADSDQPTTTAAGSADDKGSVVLLRSALAF